LPRLGMNRPVRVHHVLFMFVLCEARFLEKIPIRAFRVPRRISITREERAENVSHHCTGDRHTGAAGVSDWCTAAAIGRPVARIPGVARRAAEFGCNPAAHAWQGLTSAPLSTNPRRGQQCVWLVPAFQGSRGSTKWLPCASVELIAPAG